jgi:hypothetical protein
MYCIYIWPSYLYLNKGKWGSFSNEQAVLILPYSYIVSFIEQPYLFIQCLNFNERYLLHFLYCDMPSSIVSNPHLAGLASLHKGGGGASGSWNTL